MGPILLGEVASGAKIFPVVVRDFGRIVGIVTAILEEERQGSFKPVTLSPPHDGGRRPGSLQGQRSHPCHEGKHPRSDQSLDVNITARVVAEIADLIVQG